MIDNEYALDLYVDLILKYYKDSNFIPISNLYERVNSYKLLFPKLFKALKFKVLKNNILILINDYLNAGVIPDVDLKKNKKLIQDNISKIFNEALKIKFSNTSKALQNEKYLDLRFFLEIAINIEYYGFRDEEDGNLLIKEAEAEAEAIEREVEEWNQREKMKQNMSL